MNDSSKRDLQRGPSAPVVLPEFEIMLPPEFVLCMQRLQWHQNDCADFFDVTTRQVFRWQNGHTSIPRPVAILLRVMSARSNPTPPDLLLFAAPLTQDQPHAVA